VARRDCPAGRSMRRLLVRREEGTSGFASVRVRGLTGRERGLRWHDPTVNITSWANPTARGLTGDVDPLPARGIDPAFDIRRFYLRHIFYSV